MRIWLGILAATAALAAAAGAWAGAKPVQLTRAAIRLKDGEVWGHWGSTLACSIALEEFRWKAGRDRIDPKRLAEVFDEEVTGAGLKGTRSESLFDESPSGGLQVGIAINHIDAQLCSASQDGTEETRTWRGKMTMSAEWQVYDPVKAEVIARIETSASGEQGNRTRDGIERVMIAAFRANTRQLLGQEAFRRAIASETASAAPAKPTALPFAARTGPGVPPAETSKSVATILTGDGWGSGFLISREGYMLTNQHVVGSAAQVRIRWSDKSEMVAQVLRTDRRRDVALLKVDPAGRTPLPLRSDTPSPGDPVVAIGTPLDKEFQNTVTKGVISARRVVEGQTFVQSDVAVDHGNSGGPLLDDQGRVVAITDWGYAPDGVSHNLNFFIPIQEALEVLGMTAVATPESPNTSALAAKPVRKPR